MSATTITLSERLSARVEEQARKAGQPVGRFVENVLDTVLKEVAWEGRYPVLSVPSDAAVVTVEQIEEIRQHGDIG